MQSTELRLQREELTLTRNQLGKQTELLQKQVTADHQRSIPQLTLRKARPGNDWNWTVENNGGNAKYIELLNLDKKETVGKWNSFPHGDSFSFPVWTISHALSYEARYSSDSSERFRQCWEIENGTCKEITQGPEQLQGKIGDVVELLE